MRRIILAAALLLSVPLAHATPPSEAEVDRLLQVMEIGRTLEIMHAQTEQATRQMGQSMLDADAPAEQRAKLESAIEAHLALLRQALTADRLQPIFRKVYTDVFTAAEVQAMTEFYSSEVGRGILRKTPEAADRSMQALQPWMQDLLQQVRQSLETEFGAGAHGPADAIED